MHATIRQNADNAVQTMVRMTVEIEGKDKPGCVADALQRYYFRTK